MERVSAMQVWENVWSFDTARFSVRLDVTGESDAPDGHFEEADDVEFAREGGWHWFAARVQVVFRDDTNPKNWAVQRDDVLGEDYLGACSYHGLSDFKSGGYFRDMVASAIEEARGKLERMAL
jgi:hypothetical protein